jgi:hypothetical protein
MLQKLMDVPLLGVLLLIMAVVAGMGALDGRTSEEASPTSQTAHSDN